MLTGTKTKTAPPRGRGRPSMMKGNPSPTRKSMVHMSAPKTVYAAGRAIWSNSSVARIPVTQLKGGEDWGLRASAPCPAFPPLSPDMGVGAPQCPSRSFSTGGGGACSQYCIHIHPSFTQNSCSFGKSQSLEPLEPTHQDQCQS